MKIEFSHYGLDGPRNIGILIRMNKVGVMLCFWKWYLDLRLK
jgi:hypothetical protein